MLKINKHVTRVVAGAVSAGVLMPSCVPAGSYDDLLYNVDHPQKDLGQNAIPIRLNVSPNQAAYIEFLQKLSEDIIKYPVVAKQFHNNPKLFMERYGYRGDINLDDDLLRLIIALGDDDINRAIKLGDAGLFIDLCSEKGLLNNNLELYANLRDQLNKQLSDLGLELPTVEELQAGVAFALIITVLIALAIVVNVTVTVSKTDDISGAGGKREYQQVCMQQSITENNPVFYVWFMKQKGDKSFILVDEYMERQIDGIISKIKEKNPGYFEKTSEMDFRNLIKLNTVIAK
ncbi:hypothetical protein FACS189451_03580 [Bacteroidia bacterium]|nr:hypothetical protein FACS189451_03580 [Bacteroidia bacterium]